MKTVSAYAAKTHLPRLLAEVAAGETIVITKHGTPIAQIVPMPAARRPDVDQAIADWREFRRCQNITAGGLSIRESIEEGRM